jgi:hypothetical protein
MFSSTYRAKRVRTDIHLRGTQHGGLYDEFVPNLQSLSYHMTLRGCPPPRWIYFLDQEPSRHLADAYSGRMPCGAGAEEWQVVQHQHRKYKISCAFASPAKLTPKMYDKSHEVMGLAGVDLA